MPDCREGGTARMDVSQNGPSPVRRPGTQGSEP